VARAIIAEHPDDLLDLILGDTPVGLVTNGLPYGMGANSFGNAAGKMTGSDHQYSDTLPAWRKGKNIGLGRIREALGMNKPGEPFAFSMIAGRMAKVIVSHRPVGEDLFPEIKKIASAG